MSTLFLNKSLPQLGLPYYQFFFSIVGFYSIIYFHIYYEIIQIDNI